MCSSSDGINSNANRHPIFRDCSRSMPSQRFALPSEVPGLAARRIAADILDGVLHKHRTLDEQLDGAAAQILGMEVPDHAAVDLSVRLVQSDRRAAKYAGLVNAVLRRCAREGLPLIDEVKSQTLDLPPWLFARWSAHYGETVASDIANAIGQDPSLDITVKS